MKEPERGTQTTLARFLSGLRTLPQSTKILLVALLLVAGVALWYVGLYLPAQGGQEGAMAPQTTPTPGPIEAPPIPPLTPSEAVRQEEPQAPSPQPQPPAPQEPPRTAAPPRAAQATTPPPNPFVPLVVEAPAPPTGPISPIPRGGPVVVAPPPRVEVRPQAPLPTPSTGRTPLPGTAGALPAPKVLTPVARVEAPGLPQERVAPQAPLALVEAPLPQEEAPPEEGPTPSAAPSPKTPLEALVEERGLKLSGTLLGPVSVAILESKDGYLVLPAGSPIPGSEAIVKGVEEGRVTLALKEERMDLTLSGGGQ